MQTSTPTKALACGHPPSEHGPHTTGTAHLPDGREVCCACADQWERAELTKPATQTWHGYLGRWKVTNWTGALLGTVTTATDYTNNFGARITCFRLTMFDGTKWHGRGTGEGMICTLRRCKQPGK